MLLTCRYSDMGALQGDTQAGRGLGKGWLPRVFPRKICRWSHLTKSVGTETEKAIAGLARDTK